MASNTARSGAGRWQCQKCCKSNSAEFNTCRCGVRRGDGWCRDCQDIIYPHKKYCRCVTDICDIKPADNMHFLNGDWVCPSCKTPQFAKRVKCRWANCDGKRPSVCFTSSVPPTQAAHEPAPNMDSRYLASTHLKGDWDCSSCGSHQFARGTTCRDYGAEKHAGV